MNGEKVRLFMRVDGHSEVCIGYARTIREVPVLLEEVAAMLRAGIQPDEFEIGIPATREPSR